MNTLAVLLVAYRRTLIFRSLYRRKQSADPQFGQGTICGAVDWQLIEGSSFCFILAKFCSDWGFELWKAVDFCFKMTASLLPFFGPVSQVQKIDQPHRPKIA